MIDLLRRFWRQVALVALIALPVLVLMVLGVVWLTQSNWFYHGLIAMALAAVAATIIRHSIRKSGQDSNAERRSPDSAWSPAEIKAWDCVQTIAIGAQSAPPKDLDGLQKLATAVVKKVAEDVHGASDLSWMRFTVPELLLAAEMASKELRDSIRTRVPGAESISVADGVALYRFYMKHEAKGRFAIWAYRVFRLVASPQTAVIQEANGYLSGKGFDTALSVLQGWLARLLVEEVGRAAINLYSGRYRLAAAEARDQIALEAPEVTGPVPVRILIAGQVNAGKSSLTNALLASVMSPVSQLPTPGGFREFRTEPGKELDLVVLDAPGLSSAGDNRKSVVDAAKNADVIVWLARANSPAREPDMAALREIREWFDANSTRKPPEMIMALTHVDKISPAKEWAPPYDLVHGNTAKALNIRTALEQVGRTLGFTGHHMIPLVLGPDEAPYNLNALWSVIGATLKDAQLTALDRQLKAEPGFGLLEELTKAVKGGRFLLDKLWMDRFGSQLSHPIKADHEKP